MSSSRSRHEQQLPVRWGNFLFLCSIAFAFGHQICTVPRLLFCSMHVDTTKCMGSRPPPGMIPDTNPCSCGEPWGEVVQSANRLACRAVDTDAHEECATPQNTRAGKAGPERLASPPGALGCKASGSAVSRQDKGSTIGARCCLTSQKRICSDVKLPVWDTEPDACALELPLTTDRRVQRLLEFCMKHVARQRRIRWAPAA